ncbi:putative permease [Corynebacterium kalinowskii]|uniref:Permease n=1 Tax=Corynebacterium kalinowskii TaxID=2675216 RepID=A0A6B8VDN1_9CORY|nr:permease [Corynebacterium kalinowskii]QGU01169.1 putative permease [Corynebacterium kalinowskii]
MNIVDFIQYQILGMRWLNDLVGSTLRALSIDTASRIGGSLQFFIYDTIKIAILLCLLIYGVSYLQSYFPPERSRRILGRFRGLKANTIGALLGTITPFCSCSSIPIFMGFTAAKLPMGVTFSFLISSPMVDIASLVLLSSVFGFKIAFAYVVVGLLIAIIGGTIIEKLRLENDVVGFSAPLPELDEPQLSRAERHAYAKEQMLTTFKSVLPYILIGVGIGALIHNWIPQEWITSLLGSDNPFGVILATLVGIPMYADIFGTLPVAEALLAKGAQLGTILAFMMATTTLSLPSLVMLKRVVSARLLGIFLGLCTIGIIAVGYLFNSI